jgi:glycosyltransferase involved in cell wall biosynthesis
LDGYIGPQRSLFTKLALWPAATASRLQLISHLQAEVAVSKHDFHALRRRYWPLRNRFRQIYHSRIHEGEQMEARERRKTVLCVGTLGRRKGQPYLAQAFARVASEFTEWNLLFIGRADPESAAQLEGLLDLPELRGRAAWIPGCSDEELKRWLSSVEIFVMPSLHEGLGLTLQEALYYRCACMGTRVGGVPDLIQDGDNGMLVPVASVEAIAEGLRVLMSDERMRVRFRSRSRESVLEKGMTMERMVASYGKLYDEVT